MSVITRSVEPSRLRARSKSATSEMLGGTLTTYDPRAMRRAEADITAETRLVLINPEQDSGHAIAKFVPSPYHGTWRMKHFLEGKYGWKVAVIDFNIHAKSEVMEKLVRYRPPFVGFAFFYDNLPNDLNNLWSIRCALPESFLVAGGIEVTTRAEEYIAKLPIDGVLKGEGEFALAALMAGAAPEWNAVDKDALIERASSVPGWLFKTSDGTIVRAPPAHPFNAEQYSEVFETYSLSAKEYHPYWNFIQENYDDDLLDVLDVNPKMIRLISANYCPYGCSFCASTKFLNFASGEKKVKVVGASAQQLFDKAASLLAENPNVFIYIDDENFMALPERAYEFCSLVKESGLKGDFGCRGTAQLITEEICAALCEAGFKVVAFGAESWDDTVLADFNKRLQNGRSDVAIRNITSAGMKCSFNVILVAPTITEPGLIKTCDKIVEYTAMGCNVGMTTCIVPYPGTKYFQSDDYVRVEGVIAIPGTDETMAFPCAVLPNDPRLRALMPSAQEMGTELLDQWRKTFAWRDALMPREVCGLAFIFAIFCELGIIDEDGRRDRILAAASDILGNKRPNFVRAKGLSVASAALY